MSEVTIKIDDEADKLFNDLGLDFNTAINIFLKTSINTHKIEVNKQLYTDNDNSYNNDFLKKDIGN
ncbi:type II toxin-antitoxin system antitoxin, RelB/DinJ family [Brachyspira murdochii]|uniref:type II toxin-antitoxin system antitoxin, RelB/DinJ family n=1 Tax=Brachyspira murdochii TaxID=84378 RepID=UPI001E4018E1|nr:type II toxin-antitoxin system antitoxin, RelB/DinJ family [Brachyspira murdochii]